MNRNIYGRHGNNQVPVSFRNRPNPVQPRPSLKRLASQTERLVAAACFLSIILNLSTYAGGIIICLLAYLLASGRAPFLAQKAARALLYHTVVWGLIGASWVIYRLYPEVLGIIFFYPFSAFIWFWAIIIALFRAVRCL